MDYKRRVLDLLSKFKWHEGFVETLSDQVDHIDRYAVVSENVHDNPFKHWIDGFANSWAGAAQQIVASRDDDWTLVGVYDLYGEPGDEIVYISTRVAFEVGDGTSVVGRDTDTFGFDNSAPVGTHRVEWAYEALGIETDEE